ncbi:MAG: sigma-70 family RNA polymerase sigma factor [Clostridia bacterium]|nr:sigma-70 family RNA polymerase sigma factor [Clostridia bacterium]
MDDLQIIALYNARDSAAVRETDAKYGHLCYTVADDILHCKEDNEECVNDTYLTAWNTIPPEKPVYFSAYLCRITRNLSLKKYEHMHAKKRNKDVDVSLSELNDMIMDKDIFKEVEDRELGEEISRFLRALPETERNVFIRKYVLFHSVKSISADFSFSKSKVKSMLARTRKKLAEHLKRYYGGYYE